MRIEWFMPHHILGEGGVIPHFAIPVHQVTRKAFEGGTPDFADPGHITQSAISNQTCLHT